MRPARMLQPLLSNRKHLVRFLVLEELTSAHALITLWTKTFLLVMPCWRVVEVSLCLLDIAVSIIIALSGLIVAIGLSPPSLKRDMWTEITELGLRDRMVCLFGEFSLTIMAPKWSAAPKESLVFLPCGLYLLSVTAKFRVVPFACHAHSCSFSGCLLVNCVHRNRLLFSRTSTKNLSVKPL